MLLRAFQHPLKGLIISSISSYLGACNKCSAALTNRSGMPVAYIFGISRDRKMS